MKIELHPAKQQPNPTQEVFDHPVRAAMVIQPGVNSSVFPSIDSAVPAQKAETMSTAAPVVPATSVTSATPKVSWLKKVGSFVGKILKFVVNDEQKVAAVVTPALEAALPQYAPLIAAGDALATKITKVITQVEVSATAVGAATTGEAKLNAALAQVNPDIDAWVAAAFPGSKPLSSIGRTALVNAFVTVANEVEADVAPPPPAA